MKIRRYYAPGAIVFLTQVVYGRQPIFQHPQHLALLRSVLHNVQDHHPYQMIAYVFLPDHFHLLIRPHDGATFSDVMHSLKRNFSLDYKAALSIHGRMRFPVEIVRAVRREVGADFIVMYRLSILDLVEGGNTYDEVETMAKALVEARQPEPWRREARDLRVFAFAPDNAALLADLGAWPQVEAARVQPYRGMRVWDAAGGASLVFDADALGES